MAENVDKKTLALPLVVPRNRWWRDIYKSRWPYLFISPFFLLYAVFGVYPVIFSIYLSFTEWKGLGPIKFVAFKNFALLMKDQLFWLSMKNGVILFFLYVPIMTFLAIVLAVMLNSRRIRGFRFFRTILFLPYIMNIAAASFTFRLLLNQKYGLVNLGLAIFQIPPMPWLESMWGARISLSLLVIWAWLGYNMVIMLAGLQTIPNELTEAAMIDGASPIQAFFYITIPLLRPVILFSVILSTMGSFNLFGEIYNLYNGTAGPMNAALTPIVGIFLQAFANLRMGYASAMAYVYFMFIFVLTILQFRYFGKTED